MSSRDLNRGLGIDFQPGFQEGLVSNRGSDMIHEIGVACPKCRTSDAHANMLRDGQAQTRSPNCRRCGGDGWLFRDPVTVRGLATSIRQQKNNHDIGVAQPGDMQFSVVPGAFSCEGGYRHVARGDRFTALWSQPNDDGQTIVRGAATMGENVRLEHSVRGDEDRLWYEPAKALWCEDEDGEQYVETADFVLGPGRVIRWVGKQPPVGRKYVIKYEAHFEWIVFAPPQERVDRGTQDIGALIMLRKRHVVFVNDNSIITDEDRRPLSSRMEC